MEVYEKAGAEPIAWEDQEMLPEDQTGYRALAARLKFLAVDMPNLLLCGAKHFSPGGKFQKSTPSRKWARTIGNPDSNNRIISKCRILEINYNDF